MAGSRSSARLSEKAASASGSKKPTKQKAAPKSAKAGSSTTATVADSDVDSNSDAPITKRRRTNNGKAKQTAGGSKSAAASAVTSEAVSPASFEFSRAGTTDTALTSGSDFASTRGMNGTHDDGEEEESDLDDENDGDYVLEEENGVTYAHRVPKYEESEEELEAPAPRKKKYPTKWKGKQKVVIPVVQAEDDDESRYDGSPYEEPGEKAESPASAAPTDPYPVKRKGKWKVATSFVQSDDDDESLYEEILEFEHGANVETAVPAPKWSWHPTDLPEETDAQRSARLEAEYGGLYDEEYAPDVLDESHPDFPRTAYLEDDPNNTRRNYNDRASLYRHHPELRNVWRDLGLRRHIKVKKDPQPPGLALNLLPFQREGLHWMRVQEKGIYRGGILADEMGMGKTIQTLALIMTNPNAGINLVVAPTVALMQWKAEIEKYTGDALKVYLFHGTSRTTDHKELSKYQVVLTSYNILESVYRKQHTGYRRKDGIVKEDSVLHKVKYHRVILDEAHNIKERTNNTAKAVFALKTKYKLCLSGTPLQNRIGELFSLLRFLEVDPFSYYYCRKCPCKQLHWKFINGRNCEACGCAPMSHLNFFNYECLKPIQRDGNEGVGQIAYNNIRHLMKHIMLRRTKNEREDDLGLPNKVVRIRRDKFSEEELDLYDSIYSDGKRKFETYARQGVVLNNYANIFTLITRMRQMADHPDLVLRKHAEDGQVTLVCGICDEEAEEAINSKCRHTYCRDCVTRYVNGYSGEEEAPECPKCHIPLVIDLAAPALEADSYQPKQTSIVNRIDMTNWRSSTKIEALCHELHRLRRPYQTTKSIVFSQFTSMLQLIEWRLNHAGFKTVMLQGSMSPAQRDATIKYFMTHVEVEVFLVSLKAGGVALNLIEANHVFLMEPWWNPSVEWQAADRIHRIGQTRVCTVTRMVVEDSIESRIIELQEKKSRMIEATVNADQKAMERLTADDMRFLFQN